MPKWLHKLRWWGKPAAAADAVPPTPFAVACSCGHTQRGLRGPKRQIIPCPGCGRKLFVLPMSAWAAGEGEPTAAAIGAPDPAAPDGKPAVWKLPLLGAAAALVLVTVLVFSVYQYVLREDDPPNADRTASERGIRATVRAARESLQHGELELAHRQLSRACAELRNLSPALPADESRAILDLHRQLEIAVQLSDHSVEELLVQAHQKPRQEWEADFHRLHAGKCIVFDAPLVERRVGPERVELDYRLHADQIPARLDLSELGLRAGGQRVLFGARLAGIQLVAHPDQAAEWVIRFQPGSFVMLQEPPVVKWLGLAAERERRSALDRTMDVLRQLRGFDPPAVVARQVVATKTIEQWGYGRPPRLIIAWERRGRGTP